MKLHAKCQRPLRGFTLLEVLVALLLLAIVLAALIRSVGQEADALGMQRDATQAMWVASNRIAEIRLAPGTASNGHSQGQARMGERDWIWRAEVNATDVAGIQRIHVGVYADAQSADPVASLDGFDGGDAP